MVSFAWLPAGMVWSKVTLVVWASSSVVTLGAWVMTCWPAATVAE
jgi:hypothetical protein